MESIVNLKEKFSRVPDYVYCVAILFVCLIYRFYYFGYLNPGVVLYNSDSVSYFFPVDIFRGAIDLYLSLIHI